MGEEGIASLRDTPCDLVLLDMIMDPGIKKPYGLTELGVLIQQALKT